jgi:hypothetical protein
MKNPCILCSDPDYEGRLVAVFAETYELSLEITPEERNSVSDSDLERILEIVPRFLRELGFCEHHVLRTKTAINAHVLRKNDA